MKLFRRLHKKQKGFTLVELLVVVAILGILAAIVIPNVASFIGTGKSEAKKTELADMQTAVTAYMAAAQTSTMTAIAKTNDFSSTVLASPLSGRRLPQTRTSGGLCTTRCRSEPSAALA